MFFGVEATNAQLEAGGMMIKLACKLGRSGDYESVNLKAAV